MALFDRPFRYVPLTDPAESNQGADTAVVDSVETAAPLLPNEIAARIELLMADGPKTGELPAAGPRTAAADDAAVAAQHARTQGPATSRANPSLRDAAGPGAAPPRVEIPVTEAPTDVPKDVAADTIRTAAAASDSGAALVTHHGELVPHEERGLRSAGETGELVVFSRVVPSESKPSLPGDTQRLVTAIDEADPVLDQLRSLAASLHQARTGRELKVIAVTSSISGEGKTLLAANLALTLSRSYMRQVLMIDTDLRRPNLHRLFGVPSQEGIRLALDAVRDGRPVAVQEVAPRLALLPAGKPVRDPISVLASDAMHRLVTAATAAFDWIILDAPPVGMLPDVSLLSSLSDSVLLVVESGRVRYDLVQRTVESIGADRIFGVVLNKVPEHEIVAAYGMHYYAPYR